ncbi:unnamed protein product [Vicia faba]|uniref:Uncharacterized protein n=1 Tax=Vicia faba TaxID=3906 RepID=A0AAV0ZHQ8_VICFA|nr:unnamed protein product [Vicia faba]
MLSDLPDCVILHILSFLITKHAVRTYIDAQVFPYSCYGPPLFLFNWLLEFANIKSLTVTATTLKVLALIPGLLKFKIPSLERDIYNWNLRGCYIPSEFRYNTKGNWPHHSKQIILLLQYGEGKITV